MPNFIKIGPHITFESESEDPQFQISSAFQCSTCSRPTCTSSAINFFGVEGPFSIEVGPSRVIWPNCYLVGCVGVFSQLHKCLHDWWFYCSWDISSFWFEVHSGAACTHLKWRKIWFTSCICVWFFQSNIPLVVQSAASPHQLLKAWIRVDRRLNFCCNPLLLTYCWLIYQGKKSSLTLFRMRGSKKGPPTSFSPVTSKT